MYSGLGFMSSPLWSPNWLGRSRRLFQRSREWNVRSRMVSSYEVVNLIYPCPVSGRFAPCARRGWAKRIHSAGRKCEQGWFVDRNSRDIIVGCTIGGWAGRARVEALGDLRPNWSRRAYESFLDSAPWPWYPEGARKSSEVGVDVGDG